MKIFLYILAGLGLFTLAVWAFARVNVKEMKPRTNGASNGSSTNDAVSETTEPTNPLKNGNTGIFIGNKIPMNSEGGDAASGILGISNSSGIVMSSGSHSGISTASGPKVVSLNFSTPG